MLILNLYVPYLSGSFISLTDTYLEMKKLRANVDSLIVLPENYKLLKNMNNENFFDPRNTSTKKMIIRFRRMLAYKSYITIFKSIKQIKNVEEDVVISSTWFFHELIRHEINFNLKCNKLILLDSLNLYEAEIKGELDKLGRLINNSCKESILLSNPSNFKYKELFNKNYEYYTKLSQERLRLDSRIEEHWKDTFSKLFTIPRDYIDDPRILLRSEELRDYYRDVFLHSNRFNWIDLISFSKYAYARWPKGENNDIYIENIGKLIFEYLMKGKPVDYYPWNKDGDDGLTYYLKLFGVDDNKKHLPLQVPAEEVKRKLIMNKKDLLINAGDL